jgi:hypothetical protein
MSLFKNCRPYLGSAGARYLAGLAWWTGGACPGSGALQGPIVQPHPWTGSAWVQFPCFSKKHALHGPEQSPRQEVGLSGEDQAFLNQGEESREAEACHTKLVILLGGPGKSCLGAQSHGCRHQTHHWTPIPEGRSPQAAETPLRELALGNPGLLLSRHRSRCHLSGGAAQLFR